MAAAVSFLHAPAFFEHFLAFSSLDVPYSYTFLAPVLETSILQGSLAF